MLVIVRDHFIQRCEPAIVIKTAFLVAPKPTQRCCPVLFGWRPGRLKIIDPYFFRRMQARSWFGVERRHVATGAVGFPGEECFAAFSLSFVVAAFRRFGRWYRELIKLQGRQLCGNLIIAVPHLVVMRLCPYWELSSGDQRL